jgi:hypothetical protein
MNNKIIKKKKESGCDGAEVNPSTTWNPGGQVALE